MFVKLSLWVLQKWDVSIFCLATQGAKQSKWQRIDKDIEARECSSLPNYSLEENTIYSFF
jgi:hypothetical protein